MKAQKQSFKSNRKIIIGVIVGFLVTALLYGIVTGISVYISVSYLANVAPSEWVKLTHQPNQTLMVLQWVFTGIRDLIFLLGGMITGVIVKKRGWLYGGVVGVIWDVGVFLFTFAVISIYTFFPQYFFIHYAQDVKVYEHYRNIQLHMWITGLPDALFNLAIPLAVVGGWIGEKLQTRRVTKKVNKMLRSPSLND